MKIIRTWLKRDSRQKYRWINFRGISWCSKFGPNKKIINQGRSHYSSIHIETPIEVGSEFLKRIYIKQRRCIQIKMTNMQVEVIVTLHLHWRNLLTKTLTKARKWTSQAIKIEIFKQLHQNLERAKEPILGSTTQIKATLP